jgi:hypothetical protein
MRAASTFFCPRRCHSLRSHGPACWHATARRCPSRSLRRRVERVRPLDVHSRPQHRHPLSLAVYPCLVIASCVRCVAGGPPRSAPCRLALPPLLVLVPPPRPPLARLRPPRPLPRPPTRTRTTCSPTLMMCVTTGVLCVAGVAVDTCAWLLFLVARRASSLLCARVSCACPLRFCRGAGRVFDIVLHVSAAPVVRCRLMAAGVR